MEAAAQARANTTPELLARQRRALKPTTGAQDAVATTNAVVVTEASLRAFYEQHNPANTAPDRLRIVLQHYDGRHDALLRGGPARLPHSLVGVVALRVDPRIVQDELQAVLHGAAAAAVVELLTVYELLLA